MSYSIKKHRESTSRGRSGSNGKILPALRRIESNLMYKPKSFKMKNNQHGKGGVYAKKANDESSSYNNFYQKRADLVTGTVGVNRGRGVESKTMDINREKRRSASKNVLYESSDKSAAHPNTRESFRGGSLNTRKDSLPKVGFHSFERAENLNIKHRDT